MIKPLFAAALGTSLWLAPGAFAATLDYVLVAGASEGLPNQSSDGLRLEEEDVVLGPTFSLSESATAGRASASAVIDIDRDAGSIKFGASSSAAPAPSGASQSNSSDAVATAAFILDERFTVAGAGEVTFSSRSTAC